MRRKRTRKIEIALEGKQTRLLKACQCGQGTGLGAEEMLRAKQAVAPMKREGEEQGYSCRECNG